jgi:hypothetical protein
MTHITRAQQAFRCRHKKVNFVIIGTTLTVLLAALSKKLGKGDAKVPPMTWKHFFARMDSFE